MISRDSLATEGIRSHPADQKFRAERSPGGNRSTGAGPSLAGLRNRTAGWSEARTNSLSRQPSSRVHQMDEALDEYGLPSEWRREEPEEDLWAEDEARLAPFREWCDLDGLRAFPADPRTVYLFVTEGGVTGEQLYGI